MTSHRIHLARLAAIATAMVAAIIVVVSLRTSPLPGFGASWTGWFGAVDPADGALAVLRLLVLAGLSYLLLATLLVLASMILRSDTVDRTAATCTGPALQRFLRASAGVGVGTVTSLQSLAASAAPPPVTGPLDPEPAATADPTAGEVTTLTRMDEPETATKESDQTPGPIAPPESGTATSAPADPDDADGTDWWTVEPGDHLWRIAEETLLDHRGEAPSLEQTAAYWHVVCEANHNRLVDPDNPDLIMPGQLIVLPPVPA